MSTSEVALDHGRRYIAALLAYQGAQGISPERKWRALLYLMTSTKGLWEAGKGHLDLAQGTAHLAPSDFEHLPTSERALLALAINLFSERGAVNVARLISCLDPAGWQATIAAIHLYRTLPARWRPRHEPPATSPPSCGPAMDPGRRTNGAADAPWHGDATSRTPSRAGKEHLHAAGH